MSKNKNNEYEFEQQKPKSKAKTVLVVMLIIILLIGCIGGITAGVLGSQNNEEPSTNIEQNNNLNDTTDNLPQEDTTTPDDTHEILKTLPMKVIHKFNNDIYSEMDIDLLNDNDIRKAAKYQIESLETQTSITKSIGFNFLTYNPEYTSMKVFVNNIEFTLSPDGMGELPKCIEYKNHYFEFFIGKNNTFYVMLASNFQELMSEHQVVKCDKLDIIYDYTGTYVIDEDGNKRVPLDTISTVTNKPITVNYCYNGLSKSTESIRLCDNPLFEAEESGFDGLYIMFYPFYHVDDNSYKYVIDELVVNGVKWNDLEINPAEKTPILFTDDIYIGFEVVETGFYLTVSKDYDLLAQNMIPVGGAYSSLEKIPTSNIVLTINFVDRV